MSKRPPSNQSKNQGSRESWGPREIPGGGMDRPEPQGAERRVDPARDRAYRWLAKQTACYPELTFDDMDETGLSPRDAAFAHAIYHAAVKRWLTLSYLLNGFLEPNRLSDLEPDLSAALLGGAAQLYFLDKVPTHAAIDQSVEWCKQTLNIGAAGMVNAVLRRIAELRDPASESRPTWRDGRDQIPRSDGSAMKLVKGVLPANLGQRLSVIGSVPVPAVERWIRGFGAEEATKLVLHGLVDPPIILNTASARGPLKALSVAEHTNPGSHVFTGEAGELGAMLSDRQDLWVQDPASSRTVESIPDYTPARIVDLCAGQGTKTRQLATRFPNAIVIATDTDRQRLKTLSGVFRGHPRVRVVEIQDVADALRDAGGLADLVLLDVPCSNSGVLARRTEARYRLSRDSIARMVETQKEILTRGVDLVAPGGRLVYATCSVEPEENREQTAWAAATFGFTVEHEELRLPAGLPGEPENAYRDGAYTSVLRRN